MVAGIAAVVKALKPSIQVIGVEPTGGLQAGCGRWEWAGCARLLA
jgi:cysteine synthase